jgi:uncharacterized coiled-coil DUF342 family protein
MNRKLSRMIDMKGFAKLLSKIREGKKTWKDRPASAKLQTLDRELANSKKQKDIVRKELSRLNEKKNKFINPLYLAELSKQISTYKQKIKEMKREIHGAGAQSKREADELASMAGDGEKKPKNVTEIQDLRKGIFPHNFFLFNRN